MCCLWPSNATKDITECAAKGCWRELRESGDVFFINTAVPRTIAVEAEFVLVRTVIQELRRFCGVPKLQFKTERADKDRTCPVGNDAGLVPLQQSSDEE